MTGLAELFALLIILPGGIAGIIAASGWAKAEQIRAGRKAGGPMASESAILAELQSMKQQLQEMQNTTHQFDISFDAALSRLEQRVERLETKEAARAAVDSTQQPVPQQIGRR